MNIKEFKEYLEIDKNALDEEIMRQPSLLFQVSEAFAEAAFDRDRLKEDAAKVAADLDAHYRNKYEKATEGAIKSKIQSNKEYRASIDLWLNAKQQADVLIGLKDAFQQRSYMLRDLVSLYTANYFETDSVRTNAAQDQLVYSRTKARMQAARDARK